MTVLQQTRFFELATLGKGLLNMYGSIELSSSLTNLVSFIMTDDDFDIEDNRYAIDAILRISKMLSDLNAKCWGVNVKQCSDLLECKWII